MGNGSFGDFNDFVMEKCIQINDINGGRIIRKIFRVEYKRVFFAYSFLGFPPAAMMNA